MSKKLDKNLEKSRRKTLIEDYEQQHPHHTEGILDEAMLENNSYYDIGKKSIKMQVAGLESGHIKLESIN